MNIHRINVSQFAAEIIKRTFITISLVFYRKHTDSLTRKKIYLPWN